MMFNKNIFLLLFLLSLGHWAFGQEPGLPTEQVDVVKSFDARLLDTERQLIKPELPPLDTSTKSQIYNVISKTLMVDYLPPKIRPIAMQGDELQKGYQGFARLGGGIPSSIYGEGSYNLITDKNLDVGINAYHHSANNSSQVENQRFSYTKFGVDGTYFMEQGYAVNAKLGFSRDVVHYYGYNDRNEELGENISKEQNAVKQRFALFDASVGIFNGERTAADFNYSARLDFYSLRDNFASKESGYDLKIGATKWFNDAHPLSVQLRTDFTAYRDTAKQSLNNFFLTPSFTYHHDVFKAKIGFNLASHSDEFTFFPDLELSANIIDGIVSAFVGATGTLQKNNFRNLSDYNPYIVSKIEVKNTNYYHYYGGIRGNYQGIDYNAQVGYKTADNLALFLLDDLMDTIPRFDILYDTVKIFNIQASLTAPVFKGLEVTATINQNFYTLQNEEKAWHLPSFTANIGAKYITMEDKLAVTVEVYLENGVPYKDILGDPQNLNGLLDINVGAEYFFTENIGAFVRLNNVLSNKRQRWHRYPQFGLNALVGVSARF